MKDTPIFITSKDRVSCLRTLVAKLTEQGYSNLHLVETGSTYGPMIDYLHTLPFPIHYAAPTAHPERSLWDCHIIDGSSKIGNWYVGTDCDVVPDCEDDWLLKLREALERHPEFPKAGLALRIDDLPDHYHRKQEVIEWEAKFWRTELEPGLFVADIDTTLALYRPGVWWGQDGMKALRLAGQYNARHLPWYSNSSQPTEEELYYKAHMQPGVGHWK